MCLKRDTLINQLQAPPKTRIGIHERFKKGKGHNVASFECMGREWKFIVLVAKWWGCPSHSIGFKVPITPRTERKPRKEHLSYVLN